MQSSTNTGVETSNITTPLNSVDTNYDWIEYYDDDVNAAYRFESVVRAVVPVIFGAIAVIGLLGNLLVIIVVTSSQLMRNTTNVLIINLSVADLLFIVICVPFTAIGYVVPIWPFGDVWCKIYQYVVHVTAYASVYTLVMMSFDRYLAVVHPVRSMTIRTVRNASILAATSWVLILSFNYPVIVEHRTVEYFFFGTRRSACLNEFFYRNDDGNDTEADEDFYHYHVQVYYACFFVFAYLAPLTLVSLLYGLMVRRLLNGVTPGTGKKPENMRGKRRVTRLVVVVVVTFALCWLPLQLILIIQFVGQYTDHSFQFVATKIACSCLAYMNSCINPILYAFLSDNFRNSFYRFFCLLACARGRGCCSWQNDDRLRRVPLLSNDRQVARSGSRRPTDRSIALNELVRTTPSEEHGCLERLNDAQEQEKERPQRDVNKSSRF